MVVDHVNHEGKHRPRDVGDIFRVRLAIAVTKMFLLDEDLCRYAAASEEK
jgi:hypothetical protein